MSRLIILLRGLFRHFGRALLAITLVVSGTTLMIITHEHNADTSTQATANDGWGSEALSMAYDGISATIIPLANACGVGSSSCYKCHNGKRAGAPNMDSTKAPWHSAGAPNMDSTKAPWHKEHAKVNKSCAGCHKGNPRLMREKMAHNRMISDPRDEIQKACSTCHKGDDLETLNKPYISLRGK